MSEKMTPCEKLGYKVGDKFTVIKDSYFEKGTIVALSEDDGSEVPWFTCGGVRRALIIGSNPDVEQTPSKLKPAKQALADAIHQNGGWPQDSEWSVQNGEHGRISFSVNKPVRHDSKSWMAKGGFNFKIEVCKPLKNWHQCVLSREEYYQAYPKADADGWIEWGGGECPVGDDSLVDVRFPDGSEYFNTDADWDWSNASDTPISHYRPSKKVVKPEFCESVMRSIPGSESIDELCAKVTEENKHQHVDAKPTIEHLAQDYSNKLDFANSKQQEADDAKAAADAALGELERACEALGLVVTQAREDRAQNPIIADFRYLKIGDAVRIVRDNIGGRYNGYEGHVAMIDPDDTRTPVLVNLSFGTMWCHEVEFIR